MRECVSLVLVVLLITGIFNLSNVAGAEEILTKLDKPVVITFWHAMSGGHQEALEDITNRFNEQYENITVKLVNQGHYGELSQKLMAAGRAGTLPAMAQTYPDWVTEYLQYDLVADLTPYIKHPEIGWTEEELNDIVKVFRESNQWDGRYYSLPFNKSTRILYYNVDMLEEYNLEVPTTWEELRHAAEVLTVDKDGDGKNDVIGLGFENDYGYDFEMFVMQAGGEFIDEETLDAKFNSPEGKAAINFWIGLIDDGIARFAGEDGYMSGPFGRGDVAMYIGSSAGIPYVARAAEGNIEWSAAVLPKGKRAATSFAGTNVTVFKSATPEEKLAAWLYIKFLINTKNTAYWAMKTGYLPVRYSALNDEDYLKYKEEHPVQGVGEQQFDAGYFGARCLGAYGAMKIVAREIEAIILGEKSVEEGLRDAERLVEEELAKANR